MNSIVDFIKYVNVIVSDINKKHYILLLNSLAS